MTPGPRARRRGGYDVVALFGVTEPVAQVPVSGLPPVALAKAGGPMSQDISIAELRAISCQALAASAHESYRDAIELEYGLDLGHEHSAAFAETRAWACREQLALRCGGEP